jgi:carboxypeptidase C (cathepsin A)
VVFIDAPGTGLSRTFGKGKAEAFYGVDGDGHAFERFIRRFLSKYDRWNSPKYLFGESYGTPRSAVLAADLRSVDLNGSFLLSQILSFDNSVDGPTANPGVDQAYALALPTYAATAWYHHKLPTQPPR